MGLALLLVATFTTLPAIRPLVAATDAPPPAVYHTMTVQPGQSLWQIARSAAPGVDTRQTVARIIDLNRLGIDGAVRAGQQIVVPAAPG